MKKKYNSILNNEVNYCSLLKPEHRDFWQAWLREQPIVGPKLKERDKQTG